MRIAFISTMAGVPWGGSEALWSATAERALREGHDVFFSTTRWPQTPEKLRQLLNQGAQAFFRRPYSQALHQRLLARLRNLPHRFSAELSQVANFRPDVILLSQGGSYDIGTEKAFTDFFLKTHIPFFVVCHSYDEKEILSNEVIHRLQRVYSRARQVLAVSAAQAAAMRRQLSHPLPNLALSANPVNLSGPQLVAYPPFSPARFAAVGILQPLKRQDMLLRIFSRTCWQHRDWQLNLYGEGPDRLRLEALVAAKGLQHKVFFQGYQKDIKQVWAQNHLLLISSTREAAPMVLTEAQCCGRAVVTTPVGDVDERVAPGNTGWISSNLSEEAYAAALEIAWQARDQWQQMGKRAYEAAVPSIDWDAEGNLLRKLIAAGK